MKLRDSDIREPLFLFLEETYGKVRILEEKIMGRSRADVIMILPDALCGIEIKSDADTYTRLATQVKDYDDYFDFNFVVVGSSHAMHIEEHVPEHWGIITVEAAEPEMPESREPDFYILRKPRHNPKARLAEQLSLLWRPELSRIQAAHQMPAYANYSKMNVRKKILDYVPADELHADICTTLLNRDYTTIKDEINAYRKSIGRRPRRKVRKRRTRK